MCVCVFVKNKQNKTNQLHDEELSVSCQSSLRKHIEVIPSLDVQKKGKQWQQIKDLEPGEVSKKISQVQMKLWYWQHVDLPGSPLHLTGKIALCNELH